MTKKNEIIIASDHAGFDMKGYIVKFFEKENMFRDLGPFSDKSVHYPDYAIKLCKIIEKEKNKKGVLICGSGIGMSMVANRFVNIRAALCSNEKMAKLSRQHNNANVLVLGSRLISNEEAIKCYLSFFKTKYEGGRHQARLDKFNPIE